MILGDSGAYLGLLSLFSFSFSVIAAVLAIDMYTLLRTGQMGRTWRVLIIASVMFALAQVVRMAELLNWRMAEYGLSQIIELVFVLALAYAFFLQRRAFTQAAELRGEQRRRLSGRTTNPFSDATEDSSSDTSVSVSHAQVGAQKALAAQLFTSAAEDDQALLPLDAENDFEIEWSHRAPRNLRLEPSASLTVHRN